MSKNKKKHSPQSPDTTPHTEPVSDNPPPELESCEKFQSYYED